MSVLCTIISVVSDSLQPHELQHARPACPSPSPKVCPSSCLLQWWCHPAISFSDALFSFCPQSFSALGTLPMSQLFAHHLLKFGKILNNYCTSINAYSYFHHDWAQVHTFLQDVHLIVKLLHNMYHFLCYECALQSYFSRVRLYASLWIVTHPISSVLGILQARILEWIAIPLSRESSQLRDQTGICYV